MEGGLPCADSVLDERSQISLASLRKSLSTLLSLLWTGAPL